MSIDAKYIELLGEDRKPRALLVAYGAKVTDQLLRHWKSDSASMPKGSVSSTVVEHLGRVVPVITAALSSGNLFQVIGNPVLVEGIKAGTHTMMQSSAGALGTVVNTSTGQIAGQLVFAPSSMAAVVAPVAVWSILNGVAGTLQLQRISQRLDVITRKIESLAVRQEADALGRVIQAIRTLDEVLDEYMSTGKFTDFSTNRLAISEHVIGAVLERNRVIVENFAERARKALTNRGLEGAEQASTLLLEEGSTVIHDMQLLNGLISAQTRIFETQLYYDMVENTRYVERRMDRIRGYMDEHQEIVRGFPSISDLQSHAQQCADEMNWFRRKVWNRSTISKARNTRELSDPLQAAVDLVSVPSFAFWQDADGIHTCIHQEDDKSLGT